MKLYCLFNDHAIYDWYEDLHVACWLWALKCCAPWFMSLDTLVLKSATGRFVKNTYGKPCHVGIHWVALLEYSQKSTCVPGYQSFFRTFASFCIGQNKPAAAYGLIGSSELSYKKFEDELLVILWLTFYLIFSHLCFHSYSVFMAFLWKHLSENIWKRNVNEVPGYQCIVTRLHVVNLLTVTRPCRARN